MTQYDDLDMILVECDIVQKELDKEMHLVDEIQNEIRIQNINTLRPFSLENNDYNAAIESLGEKLANVYVRIKTLILKLWQLIKTAFDKFLHIFDSTKRKLTKYKEALANNNIKLTNEQLNYRVEAYNRVTMTNRISVLSNELNMDWMNSDGTINQATRVPLSKIGYKFLINTSANSVSAKYSGDLPKVSTLSKHQYDIADIKQLVDSALGLYEKYPDYKKKMDEANNNYLKTLESSYQASDKQRLEFVKAKYLNTKVAYIVSRTILKEIRTIGKQTITICKTIGL